MPCAFCPAEKTTREHVFARWLTAALVRQGGEPLVHRNDSPGHPESRDAREFDFVVRAACQDCNNGWMSALESRARPLLTPMMRGERRQLTSADQKSIATWATKTAMLIEITDTDPTVRDVDRHALRKTQAPPAHTLIWLARYGYPRDAETMRIARVAGSHLEIRLRGEHDQVRAYVGTYRLGNLVFQVVLSPAHLPFVEGRSDGPFSCIIWPPSELQEWPPAMSLNGEDDFTAFSSVFTSPWGLRGQLPAACEAAPWVERGP